MVSHSIIQTSPAQRGIWKCPTPVMVMRHGLIMAPMMSRSIHHIWAPCHHWARLHITYWDRMSSDPDCQGRHSLVSTRGPSCLWHKILCRSWQGCPRHPQKTGQPAGGCKERPLPGRQLGVWRVAQVSPEEEWPTRMFSDLKPPLKAKE